MNDGRNPHSLVKFGQLLEKVHSDKLLTEFDLEGGPTSVKLARTAIQRITGQKKKIDPEELSKETLKLINIPGDLLIKFRDALGTEFEQVGPDTRPVFVARMSEGSVVIHPETTTYSKIYFLHSQGTVMAKAEMDNGHLIDALENPERTPFFSDIKVDANINKTRFMKTALLSIPLAKTVSGTMKYFGSLFSKKQDNILYLADARYLPKLLASMRQAEMFEDPYIGFGKGDSSEGASGG